jgi:two-component system chemotaxis response regulator CheY
MSKKPTEKKILVVDDDPLNCEILMELLSSEGYDVAMALSGDEALEVSRRERPHAVLLDINMPGKSGLDILRELKSIVPETPVVMLSGLYGEELVRKALREGAAGYITKPVHPLRLMELISKFETTGGG